MRIQSILVGLVALTTTVAAVDKPKFYFPKHVKRQVLNNTISSSTLSEISSESSIETELASVLPPVVATTTEPEVVKTVVNTVVIDNGRTTTLLPSIPSAEPTPSLFPTSSKEGEEEVGSTTGLPNLIITPTSSADTETSAEDSSIQPSSTKTSTVASEEDSSTQPSPTETSTEASEEDSSAQPSSTDTSSEKEITFGPSGVITESEEPASTSVDKTTEIDESTGVTFTGSAVGTGGTTTAKPTSTGEEPTITSAVSSVVEGEDDLQSSTVVATSTTEDEPVTTEEPSSTINSGITGDYSTGVITHIPEPTETSMIVELPIIESSTILPESNSTTLANDPIIESSITEPSRTSEPTEISTTSEPTTIPTITNEPIQSSDVLPEPTGNVTLIPSETDSGISFTPTFTPSLGPTVLPSATSNSTLIPILPIRTKTDSESSGYETATDAPSATGTASQSFIASVSLVTDEPPAVTPTDIAPAFTPKPDVVTDAPPNFVPSKVETYVPPTQTESTPTVTPTGLPTDMPRMVSPSGGVPEEAPEDDMVMIQIGFDQALNYEFVVGNSKSPTQIFTFLPMGISYGLGIPRDQVVMHSIQPFDTQATLGYITTLAIAWIPAASLEKLGMVIHTPSSPLYHYDSTNPSAGSVDTITSHINSAIPFIAGGNLDGVPTPKDGKSGSGKGSKSDGGVFGTAGAPEDQPASVKGMTAGIATGAVVAAAAYGAAMFFIARRYKKRKMAHKRSRSVEGPEMMGLGSPSLMGGATMSGGRMTPATAVGSERFSRGSGQTGSSGARTAKISAPMAAENSLGWN